MTKEQGFDLVFTKAYDFADIMTINQFILCVDAGFFNSYDGQGYMAIEVDNEIYEGPVVHCSKAWLTAMQNRGWTHVCWYNN